MRIGIDVSPITATRAGVGNYCYYLLKHLLALAPSFEFAGFSSGSVRVELGPFGGRVTHRHVPIPTRALYALWAATGWPKVDTFLGGVDVYHATNYFLGPVKTARRVLTVHDLAFLTVPELTSPKIQRIFSSSIGRFVREADAVMACSESTKTDIVRLLEADPAKVTVAHEAVDEAFAPMDPAAAADFLARTYRIQQPFLLFVSTLEPRKNIPVLLEAFARIKHDFPHKLVLVGGVGWNAAAIFETIERLHLSERIIQLGFVKSHTELPAFYSAADAFVFPTRYEGFGLGLLEAMVCGCPVITSNNSSVPEVVGEAALCHDASDMDGFATSIRRVLEDEALRATLISRGQAQAAKFSWRRCAEITLEVYKRLM